MEPDFPIAELKLNQIGILTHVEPTGHSHVGDPIIGGWSGSFSCPVAHTGGLSSEWPTYRFRELRPLEAVSMFGGIFVRQA
jgi:hypothetical protein